MDQKYSRIMPESEGNVFCAVVGQKVTLEDYSKVFEPEIRKILSDRKRVRILLSYTRPFEGWDIEAATKDLAYITEAGKYLEKVALIDPPEPVLLRWQTLKPLISGDLRFFTADESGKALDWVKAA